MNSQAPPIPPPSPQPKRFFDVVPPGKTTPSTTSRPIIADNGAPQADPMMTTHPTPIFPMPSGPASSEETPNNNIEEDQQSDNTQKIKVSVGLSGDSVQNKPDQTGDTESGLSTDEMELIEPVADSNEDQSASANTELAQPPNSADSELQKPEPISLHTVNTSDAVNGFSDNQASVLPFLELPAHADGGMVVVHHSGRQSKIISFALIVVVIILVVVVMDVLFDTGVIKTSLWHTHFLGTN